MRIVFMGSAEFSSVILEDLACQDDMHVVALFTQPHKPVGRKQILTPPHTYDVAVRLGIPVFQPQKLSDPKNYDILKELKPDYIVVAAYGQILRSDILRLVPCINLHTSILPKHRGASALQSTLMEGSKHSGVTAIWMNEGLDTGDILGYSYFCHSSTAKTGCLLKKLGFIAASMTKRVLRNFSIIKPLRQIGADANYAKKIVKEDGLVDFQDAATLYRKFQAFDPWPGIFLQNGLKLKEIELIERGGKRSCGEIVVVEGSSVTVGCRHGLLKILKVQAPSKTEIDAASYLRGQRLGIGDNFS